MPFKSVISSLLLLLFMQACESRDNPAPTSSNRPAATFQQEEELLRGAPEETGNAEPTSHTPNLRPNGGISSSGPNDGISSSDSTQPQPFAIYESICSATDQQHSTIEKVLFDAAQKGFSRLVTHFADAGCKEAVYTDLETATFEIISSEVLPEGGIQITYKALIKAVAVRVSAPSILADYIQKQQCGISDWSLHHFNDVSGRTCQGKQQVASGTYKYDIAKFISGSLVFGLDPTYDDSSKTPTSLSPTVLLWSQGKKGNPFDDH